ALLRGALQAGGIAPPGTGEGQQDVVLTIGEHGRLPLAVALGIARRARLDLREVLRHDAHATLDLRDALLVDVDRIAFLHRLAEGAIPDREHHRRDEHRHHALDEVEAGATHQFADGGVAGLGVWRPGLAGVPGVVGAPGVLGAPLLPGPCGPPGALFIEEPRHGVATAARRSERALQATPVNLVV